MAKDGCLPPAEKARLAKLRRMRKWSRERRTKRQKALQKALLFIERVRNG